MQQQLNWYKIAELQQQAAKMILIDGMMQKDVAAKLGVSQKTICKWNKQLKLKKPNQRHADNITTKMYLNISDFEAYLRGKSEDACNTFKKQLNGYLQANKPVQRVLIG